MTEPPTITFDDIMHRGMQRARAYQWSAAVDAYRRAVALEPESTEARFRLGWALWNQADSERPTLTDLAVVYGAQMLGLDQAARDGRKRLQGNRLLLKDAVFYLNSVIDREPKSARAYFYLSKTLQALDMRTEAEEAARMAAKLDPENEAYNSMVKTIDHGSLSIPAVEHSPNAPQTWDDLVLNPRTKRELRQMQLMLEKPDLASDLGVQPPTGILLKGPPGTGKTTIARILAHQAKCSFFAITPADIQQMYVGESEKRVKELFERARANPPSIIFIDEIDALLPIRQGGVAIHSDKVVNQFLQEMDGLTHNSRVFVIGATNRPDMLDPAVRRGGRLSREVEIPLPDQEARLQLFRICTRTASLDDDVDLEALAMRTEGYSGADIKALVNEAGMLALIRIADLGESCGRSLLMEDFDGALENLG